jgi:hypothetical protein
MIDDEVEVPGVAGNEARVWEKLSSHSTKYSLRPQRSTTALLHCRENRTTLT